MQEFNQQSELEPLYALMMDALDGPLSSEDQRRLDSAFVAHPELAAEWQALILVDDLLNQTPLVDPPTHFATRTIAALPNVRARRWAVAAAFLASLSVGLIPVFLLGLAFLLGLDFGIAAEGLLEIAGAILNGVGQLAVESVRVMASYPGVMGTLLVMIGSITLWSGLYQQLVVQPVAITS